MNRLTKEGIDLIHSFESCRLQAYKDPVGIWTIGWGHTSMAGPPKVTPGMRITQAYADEIFARDIKKYEDHVKRLVTVPINDNQYSALVSFCYNLGPGNLEESTLLRMVNDRMFTSAANEFQKWNKAKGKVLNGLTRRRYAERDLFLTPVTNSSTRLTLWDFIKRLLGL